MSLINDALKRAKHSQKGPATPVAHFLPTPPRRPRGISLGMVIGAALLLAAGCFFIGLAMAKRNSSATVTTTTVVVTSTKPATAPTAAKTAAPTTPPAAVAPLPAPVKVESPVVPAAVPGVSNAVVDAAPAAPAPPAAPPPPKLQAIIFDPQNPTAIVNGKTAHLNDVLGDFRVKAILPSSILIEYGDGSITRLNLGQ